MITSLTRYIAAGSALAVAVTFAMQPTPSTAQETFISNIWEHKVEVQTWIPANYLDILAIATNPDEASIKIEELLAAAENDRTEWAVMACGFYGRDAFGPLSRSEADLRYTYLYACALPE